MLAHHVLLVITNKMKIMAFMKCTISCKWGAPSFIGESCLDNIFVHKYLCIVIPYNICEIDDVMRLKNQFSLFMGIFYRSFYLVDHSSKIKSWMCCIYLRLFLSFVWISLAALKDFAVIYHYAFMKLIGLATIFKNHLLCNVLGLLIF